MTGHRVGKARSEGEFWEQVLRLGLFFLPSCAGPCARCREPSGGRAGPGSEDRRGPSGGRVVVGPWATGEPVGTLYPWSTDGVGGCPCRGPWARAVAGGEGPAWARPHLGGHARFCFVLEGAVPFRDFWGPVCLVFGWSGLLPPRPRCPVCCDPVSTCVCPAQHAPGQSAPPRAGRVPFTCPGGAASALLSGRLPWAAAVSVCPSGGCWSVRSVLSS